MSVVLITGASGVIGSYVKHKLQISGHEVKTLTTKISVTELNKNAFLWNVQNKYIQQNAIDGVDTVIHLAGASIGAHRWTGKYKNEILSSRVQTAALLLNQLEQSGANIKQFISMSGIAYYPDPGAAPYKEDGPGGTGFASNVCREWEAAAKSFERIGATVSILRTAPVLTPDSLLLKSYLAAKAIRIIPILGSENSHLTWVHMEDLGNVLLQLVEEILPGNIYNVVSPKACTQGEFVNAISDALKIRFLKPVIPAFLFRLLLGERAALPLTDQIVVPENLLKSGFQFQYPDIQSAMKQLL